MHNMSHDHHAINPRPGRTPGIRGVSMLMMHVVCAQRNKRSTARSFWPTEEMVSHKHHCSIHPSPDVVKPALAGDQPVVHPQDHS